MFLHHSTHSNFRYRQYEYSRTLDITTSPKHHSSWPFDYIVGLFTEVLWRESMMKQNNVTRLVLQTEDIQFSFKPVKLDCTQIFQCGFLFYN